MAHRRVQVLDRELRLGNLGKVLYPATGFTKAGVIDYYTRIDEWLLPYLRTRPLTLKRYPDGVESAPFYEKRCPRHRPQWMSTALVAHRGGKQLRYCAVNDLADLTWVAGMASLELHVLMSRGMRPERPTAVVFDLDPGPPAGLLEAAAVAAKLRRVLARIGLSAVAKVSGGKGVHCYVPVNLPLDFSRSKDFARTVARQLEKHDPEHVATSMSKAARAGKVFIDWSQNDAHKTTVCPYSLRGAEHPWVSAPVSWEELDQALAAADADALRFTPATVIERLQQSGDLFAPVLRTRQWLPGAAPMSPPAQPVWTSDGEHGAEAAAVRISLERYHAKRDFELTSEPSGVGVDPADFRCSFVVQKHAARRLHYDFRLELDGVLRSWAVPKGPSLDPDVKRLAVQVEDHPVDYARFEGRIPQDEYGGGAVIVWDFGSYAPATDTGEREQTLRSGLEAGKLDFILDGIKLRGRFTLVRTGSARDGRQQWLLIKADDLAAQRNVDILDTDPYSVVSGLWVEDVAAAEG